MLDEWINGWLILPYQRMDIGSVWPLKTILATKDRMQLGFMNGVSFIFSMCVCVSIAATTFDCCHRCAYVFVTKAHNCQWQQLIKIKGKHWTSTLFVLVSVYGIEFRFHGKLNFFRPDKVMSTSAREWLEISLGAWMTF